MKAQWIIDYEDQVAKMNNVDLIDEAIYTVVQDEQGTKRDEIEHDIVMKELRRRIDQEIIK